MLLFHALVELSRTESKVSPAGRERKLPTRSPAWFRSLGVPSGRAQLFQILQVTVVLVLVILGIQQTSAHLGDIFGFSFFRSERPPSRASSAATATVPFPPGQPPGDYTFVGLADYDRDGNVDIAARENATGILWLYPGNGTRNYPGPRVRIGNGW